MQDHRIGWAIGTAKHSYVTLKTIDGGRRWLQTRFRTPDWVESITLQFADAGRVLSSPFSGRQPA